MLLASCNLLVTFYIYLITLIDFHSTRLPFQVLRGCPFERVPRCSDSASFSPQLLYSCLICDYAEPDHLFLGSDPPFFHDLIHDDVVALRKMGSSQVLTGFPAGVFPRRQNLGHPQVILPRHKIGTFESVFAIF
jgi:hypothetical protein